MVKGKKNDHGRGFKRTKKQWENSFCDHVGKIIDNLDANQIMKIVAWASGSYLIFTTVKAAREIPMVRAAGTIASKIEEIFLGAPLAPAPADWTPADELRADIEWALASMLASYVVIEHGEDIARALLPVI